MSKFVDNSGAFKSEVEQKIVKALTECGIVAVGHAKRSLKDSNAVDTGLLRNSVTFCIDSESPDISSYKADKGGGSGSYSGTAPKESNGHAVYIGTNVHYAPYIEYGAGTHYGAGTQTIKGMRPRPYIKPSIANHKEQYRNIIVDELKK